MKKYYVIPFDILEVESVNEETDTVVLTMYCEIGSEDNEINPDSPPVFNLVIKRSNEVFELSTQNSDFTPEEETKFKECVDKFITDIKPDFETDEIDIPPTKKLVDETIVMITLPRNYNE